MVARFVVIFVGVLSAAALPAAGPPAGHPKIDPRVDAVLKRAAAAAAEIEDLKDRVSALAFIGKTRHRAGDKAGADRVMKQARETAAKIEEDTPLLMALWMLSRAEVSRGDAVGALKACDVSENQRLRWRLIFDLAQDFARQGDYAKAEAVADKLKANGKQIALAAIAREKAVAQARAGKIAEAREEAAKQERYVRYEILVEVAFAHRRLKQPEKAKVALSEARQLMAEDWEKTSNPDARATALMNHAMAQAEAGDAAGALKTFAESKFEDSKGDGGSKGYYYWRLARAFVVGGDARSAVKFAEGLKAPGDRLLALGQAAKAQAELKDKAGARATLAKARRLVDQHSTAKMKDDAAYAISEAEALLGDIPAAMAAARSASTTAQRGAALNAAGRVLLQTDRTAAARVLVEAARFRAAEVKGRRWLSMTLGYLARAGEPAVALRHLENEKSPQNKAHGLTYIAQGLIEAAEQERRKP